MLKFSLVWRAVIVLGLACHCGCINVGSRFEIMPRPTALTTPSTTKTGAAVFCPNYPEGTTPTTAQTTPNLGSPLPQGRPANTTSLERPQF